ncbi:MAG: hypothetical protein SFV15_04240 [Polyangiaceae bacterium]|nr:hypothetical protein [Polyangiaceae bacterium]
MSWSHISKRSRLGWWLTLIVCVFGVSSEALARTPFEVGYSKAQVYSAALRHLRVDLGQEVYEKDADAAYLLFHFEATGAERRTSTGSIEIISVKGGCRVVIQLNKLPSYYEQTLKDSLLEKLRGDYGAPEAPKPDAPKPPKDSQKDRDKAEAPKRDAGQK